ncbi:class I SAM-dependent methyltransferase [uncultured Xanthomonas sp.]|uniref:class I SAM-dependent methyltransferase n=1 Tax=uncultured Xanthomonas sp. TaxID=152831 RepID=UPI0025FA0BC5|nr:class I SAM-dependent methyltransferase [uncultured Xanthomonas sp.]
MLSLWEGLQSRRAVRRCRRKHPPQDARKGMMEAADFARSHHKNLAGGIVAIHSGDKI